MWADLNQTFEGSIVRLEPLRADHRSALYVASRDPRIWTWLGALEWGAFAPDREAFDVWFECALDETAAGSAVVFAIVDRRLDRVVGSTRFMYLQPPHRSVSIAWTWLSPDVWRTGVNVETKLLTLAAAFDLAGCRRVQFVADTRNERGCRVLAALPAKFEGVLRRHLQLVDGERDSACFSIIAEEWPNVRANLERRLRTHGLQPSKGPLVPQPPASGTSG